MRYKHSHALFTKGLEHLAGGVNSPVRAFAAVGGNPVFIKKAKGSTITDVDDNTYIDFVLSYGPMILGHRHKAVQRAVKAALKDGYAFGACSEKEIILAGMICDVFPGMDKIRFVNSGTEAVFSALRLARAYTGRNKIIKFTGCYHGHADALLVAAGSGLATLGLPGSAGVPKEAVKDTLIAHYNDLGSVQRHFDNFDDIAAVIIEPVAGNMGVVCPQGRFLQDLKSVCEKHGALLISDEVMAGFRGHFGGAAELYDVTADIVCLGKIIGGGFPIGAYGARHDIMQHVAPLGAMYQAGTFSGNPITMAAGIATLQELSRQDPYDAFKHVGDILEAQLLNTAKANHIELCVNRFGSMISAFFTKGPVTNYQSAQQSDTQKFARFFNAMLDGGIFLPPSQFEAWFLNSAMQPSDVDKTCQVIDSAMRHVAASS